MIFLLNIISWDCLFGSGLKIIFHWKAHLSVWCKSLLNSFAEVSTSWITENKYILSANNFAFDDRPSARSLIQTKKRRGPKLIPEGLLRLPLSMKKLVHLKYFSASYLLKSQIKHWAVYRKYHFVLVCR